MTAIPAWVTRITPELDRKLPADAQGVDYLLVDNQTRVTATDRFNFRHRADRIRTERGLDGTGQLEVSFNPAYQSLQFHQLRIHRDGQVLPWQQRARARWLDRETQLEQGIYDGNRTLLLTLDDLRVGDVLEYAYTVRGSNPVFGGRHFGGYDLQYSVAVARQHSRLLMPAGREPTVRNSPGVTMARRTLPSGEQEWLWDLSDTQPLRMDSGTPSWFYPYARTAWSEFPDWGAVARWASPMYQPSPTSPAAVQKELDALEQRYATQEERIAGALRLVQERVRYLSVSIGAGSHAPRRPEQVLAQRFGDCKDKSLLTVALLRGLGVEAWVALVNTDVRNHLGDEQASPGAFDHAIVLARWEGKDYWLDPTRAPQSGTLDHLVQANFGQALVIDTSTTELMTIATAPSAIERREITMDFDLRAGPTSPAEFKVTTRYFGAAAETMRNEYGTGDNRLERLQKYRLGYYARSFNDIQTAAPLQWQDDDQANVVTVTESYRIGKLWNTDAQGRPIDAVLATPQMDQLLQRPDMSQRQHPLGRSHPQQLDMTVRAQFPMSWRTLLPENGEFKVKDDHFSFRRTYHLQERTLTLVQQYASLDDHVDPAQMTDYLKHLQEADEWSGYRLKWSLGGLAKADLSRSNTSADGATHGTAGALALVAIGMIFGVLRLLRPVVLRLKARMDRHPLPAGLAQRRMGRGATGVILIQEPMADLHPGAEDRTKDAVPEQVEGPGREGWRGWLQRWVWAAVALLGLNLWLFWFLCSTQDQKVLQSLANWIYGLGAITLGSWLVRWLEPKVLHGIGEWQLRRMDEPAYRALLWRCGASDSFPAGFPGRSLEDSGV
ncbi:DUF3857 domain-containing transglutaminase family protein [Roseateles sp. SL47]|uniref:DUF3857 domain-containing transglutaminase family protein n=1 Tax=Roseateles sp. SL47 TaxID=2995138 RepID=UPI00226EEB57|nr:DUF3857 domain-containing transglutaminase family protein [Roseateles sp. SL47]WAC73922.1 DUF3857 domain-containing transglutaminase family protein [Roseateles sp. SL47]